MPNGRVPKVALRWISTAGRKIGGPKTTWQRTVMRELDEMGLSWGEARAKEQDRVHCQCMIAALCASWAKEDSLLSSAETLV